MLMVKIFSYLYDARMSEIAERIKAIGLTQEIAGRIVGLSAITVSRQVRGHWPVSPALLYLVETWPTVPAALRKAILDRVGVEEVRTVRVKPKI
jgi:hypothetical protein